MSPAGQKVIGELKTVLIWLAVGLVVLGAAKAAITQWATKAVKERKKLERAKDRVDVEEMVVAERAKRNAARRGKTPR